MAVIGIDLGTTNSLACVWKDGTCVLIPNEFHEYLTPSVVSIDEDGNVIVGKVAKERLITHPMESACLFKRTMGTKQTYRLQNHTFTSEELSSFVIRQLVQDAEVFLQEEIEEVILSVPAYFNDTQRSVTKQAGALAGVFVERLINEPSAAALAGREEGKDLTFLVFDFGGGTLDISVVECFSNIISILAVCGDNHLGGSDFDEAIAQSFCEQNALSYETLSQKERSYLLRQCEEMKIALNTQAEVRQDIWMRGTCYSYTLTNPSFIQCSAHLWERLLRPIHKALSDAQLQIENLDQILLVGGSSKMKSVQAYLEQNFPIKINTDFDPEFMVAQGIGMLSAMKQRKQELKDLVLTDICPFTLGVAIHNAAEPQRPLIEAIIERNATLPCSKQKAFTTVYDNQEIVSIELYQGEAMYADKNICLGKKEVHVTPAKRGAFPIYVRFTYDINGILDVEILDSSNAHKETFLITNDAFHIEEAQLAARLKELEKLKQHPREQQENRLLSERLERLYEETTREERARIRALASEFAQALESQERIRIEKERERIQAIIDPIDDHLHPYRMHWS